MLASSHSNRQNHLVEKTHIINVNATLIDKEPLEQALDDDQALAKDKDYRIQPCTPAMEYI